MDKEQQPTSMSRRVPKGQFYFTIMKEGLSFVASVMERHDNFDDRRFASGNYYPTKAEAQAVLKQQVLERKLAYNAKRRLAKSVEK